MGSRLKHFGLVPPIGVATGMLLPVPARARAISELIRENRPQLVAETLTGASASVVKEDLAFVQRDRAALVFLDHREGGAEDLDGSVRDQHPQRRQAGRALLNGQLSGTTRRLPPSEVSRISAVAEVESRIVKSG